MSDRPRLLVIGVGSIGERHLRCFQETGRCGVALCEPMEERREEVARRYGVNGYGSWEEALEAEPFSAAVIASPAPWHVPTAQALAERGVHLLIEKPLAVDTTGVDGLAETVARKDVRAAVGFVYRARPALRRLREAVRSGAFGEIVQVQVQAGQHFPHYRPAYREIYYADPFQGGGLIQDMLPHSVDAVEWIVGPATAVVVDAAHRVLEGVEVEDTVNLLTRHGETQGNFTLNQHQPVNEFTLTVIGTSGAARWELHRQRWLSAREVGGDWTEEASFDHELDDHYRRQAEAFLDLLEGKAEPLCPLAEGIRTLETTLAVLESRRAGGWVAVERSH